MPPAARTTVDPDVHAVRLTHRALDTDWIQSAAKRAFDLVLAALLLLAVLPLMLLIAFAVKLDSAGPVFFRVRRVGYRGRPLSMLKFRKMYQHTNGGPLTVGRDPRLTRVGSFLTRTRLDELPQLWDVLRGRMSIVGPRPEDPTFVALHAADYEHILTVRPGLTGITQLAFANECEILDAHDPVSDYVLRILPSKVALDRLYADCHRIGLDLAVLWWTMVAVLAGGQIAVHRDTGRMCLRRRPHDVLEEPAGVSEPAIATEVV